MWEWLKGLDLGRWWIAAIALGIVIIVAAVAAKDYAVILIGLGIIAAGFGEWMNHRMETEIRKDGTLTTFERKNRALGLMMDVVGVVLFLLGVIPLIVLAWT